NRHLWNRPLPKSLAALLQETLACSNSSAPSANGIGNPLLRNCGEASAAGISAAICRTLMHPMSPRWLRSCWPIRSRSAAGRSGKGKSSRLANFVLRRGGQFWQEDYFDTLIRDGEHLRKAVRYTEHNPAKAALVMDPRAWSWGSARRRDGYARLPWQHDRSAA